MTSRREFLVRTASLAANLPVIAAGTREEKSAPRLCITEAVSLCGEWLFRTDPHDTGTNKNWFASEPVGADWMRVQVPHTWQILPLLTDYHGAAWYWRDFSVPERWVGSAVRIEFEAVYHTAEVWINGQHAGEHRRKGYTAFVLDISGLLHPGRSNTIAVRVDNSFDEHMLPRGRSSDFPHDGGIFRPVSLLITPEVFTEQVYVDAVPDLISGGAKLTITGQCRNASTKPWRGHASFRVVDEETGLEVLNDAEPRSLAIQPGATQSLVISTRLPKAKLWHFDHPALYQLEFLIADDHEAHQHAITFGLRLFEVKNGLLHLNGERVRLTGVERMAGSNPEFGAAEPGEWITHDMDELKHLNCVFTRVHWPQDKRVLDYCDRHGILMQSEIPAWGGDTFKGMLAEPDADIIENGLEQLREMVARDRNHPSIVAWGLCNEIWGQNPAAYQFAKRMLAEAKKLDPARLCSYASNSLDQTPERDVAGLMDFIEVNEYFGTWDPRTIEALPQHLDAIHTAFPGKPIVISEYGYCACVPERPEGDSHREETLRSHDPVFRSRDYIAGAIFFDYNDYRSQAGASGTGALLQNVHGVVDVYGRRKNSYVVLREESSPIESLSVENHLNAFRVRVKNRKDLPAYTLRGYFLRAVFYGGEDIPLEQWEKGLPELTPGNEAKVDFKFVQAGVPWRVEFDVLRPTGFSAYTLNWKP